MAINKKKVAKTVLKALAGGVKFQVASTRRGVKSMSQAGTKLRKLVSIKPIEKNLSKALRRDKKKLKAIVPALKKKFKERRKAGKLI